MSRWPIARYLFSTHYPFLILILLGFYLACAVLLTVVSLLTDVRISTVDASAQVLTWLCLGYGASATSMLSTMMRHGRTRREFLLQYPLFLLALAATAAAVITLVYAGEAAVYRALDWGQELQKHRVYESATDFPAIFVSYLSVLLIWLVVGAMLGTAFYRWEGNAVLVLPIAAVVVLVTGGFNGFFGLVPALRAEDAGLGVILAVTAVAAAAVWAMIFGTVRDISLRTKTA